jgi:DNA-binding transcriptional LysR family regulator
VLELGSYHAIMACVASGTGIAVMPRSVLDTVRGGENLAVNPLAKGRLTTCLVWRKGESSAALNVLKAEIGVSRKARNSAR